MLVSDIFFYTLDYLRRNIFIAIQAKLLYKYCIISIVYNI